MNPIQVAEQLSETSKINIFEKTRERRTVEIRALFYTILKKIFNFGWTEIANFMKEHGKPTNHATIIHAVNNYEYYRKSNKLLLVYEKMFFDNYAEETTEKIDIQQLRFENEQLKMKLQSIKHQNNPLYDIISEIPNNRIEEAKEKLELMIKSWEWKAPKDRTKIYNCSTMVDVF